MDKDRGYAWVILGASTILMCIGPSTYTSFGFLIDTVAIEPNNQTWILSTLYCFWQVAGFVAAMFAKQRPRQLATTGTAIACIGFLISASTVDDSNWFYITFSLFIGFGLGLSFHTAYLVVMSNFDQYKGLANGICQVSIVVGQITAPFLFSVITKPRERFQIRALTTAVGFLTTLFFVVPKPIVQRRRSTLAYIGDKNRRGSAVSRRGSLSESLPLQAGTLLVPPNSMSFNQARPRRRSQYLLAVSASLLPNIPEEPESTASMNDTLTSASSESDVHNLQSLNSQSESVLEQNANLNTSNEGSRPRDNERPSAGDSTSVRSQGNKNGLSEIRNKMSFPSRIRRKSEGSLPSYVGNFSDGKNVSNGVQKSNASGVNATDQQTIASISGRNSESQFEPNVILNQSGMPKNQDMQNSRKKLSVATTGHKGESILDLSLLRDFHFCNMAAFSALCTVTVVNFPIVLYAYITNECVDCKREANVAMLIIYIVDLISRLVMSYLSDRAILRKRTGFLIGCGFGGILISATILVGPDQIALLYCLCIAFGLCMGILFTTEYLMFIESFGSDRFPQAYGLVNFFKLLFVGILGFSVGNPLAIYNYTIHPLGQEVALKNSSLCDPLGIYEESPESLSTTKLLLNVAIPSFLCVIAWITEDLYKASHKCSVQTKSPSQTNVDVP